MRPARVITLLGVLSLAASGASLLCLLIGQVFLAAAAHLACGALGYGATARLRGGSSAVGGFDRAAAFLVPCVGGSVVWLQAVLERWSGRKAIMADYQDYVDSRLRLGRDALPESRYSDMPRPLHVAPIADVLRTDADGPDMRKAVENLSRVGSPEAVLALRETLNHNSVEVRFYAATALARLEERLALRLKTLQERAAAGGPECASAEMDLAQACYDYAYYQVAEDVFRPQYLRETVAHARRARELGADSGALLLEGRALLGLGHFAEAEACFTRHLQGAPRHVKALLWRAEARFRLGRYAGVEEDCRAALRAGDVPARVLPVAEMWAAPARARRLGAAEVQVA